MVNDPPEGKKLELVTVLPALVLGKPLYKAMGSSIGMFSAILTGKDLYVNFIFNLIVVLVSCFITW